MRILCHLQPSGGFVCADLDTGNSAYAYWSSTNAKMAGKHPFKVARDMLTRENAFRASLHPGARGDGWRETDARRVANMRAVGCIEADV